jgi:hypothetical protein
VNAALAAAIAGTIARSIMSWASGHGVSLGSDEANAIAQAVLIVVPLVWGVVHKVKVDKRING